MGISTSNPWTGWVLIVWNASSIAIHSTSVPNSSRSFRTSPVPSGPIWHSSCNVSSNSNRPLTMLPAHPPGILCFSSNNTFFPSFAIHAAAARPPLPAPTTITSYLCFILPLLSPWYTTNHIFILTHILLYFNEYNWNTVRFLETNCLSYHKPYPFLLPVQKLHIYALEWSPYWSIRWYMV